MDPRMIINPKTQPKTLAPKRLSQTKAAIGILVGVLLVVATVVIFALKQPSQAPTASSVATMTATPTAMPATSTPTTQPSTVAPTATAMATTDPRADHIKYVFDPSVAETSPQRAHNYIVAQTYAGLDDKEKLQYVCTINFERGGVRIKYIFESEKIAFPTTGVSDGCYWINQKDPMESHLVMVKYLNLAIADVKKNGGLIYIDPDYEGYAGGVENKITTELPPVP